MARWLSRLSLCDGRCSCRRRLNLPLQFEQIAPQAVAHLHAQLGELEKLLTQFVLTPEEEDGRKRRGQDEQHERYRYELH